MLVRCLSVLVLLAALAAPTQAQACPGGGSSVHVSIGIPIPRGMVVIGHDGGRALYGYRNQPYVYGYLWNNHWYRYPAPRRIPVVNRHSSHSSHGSSRHVQAHDDHRDNGHGGGSNHRPDNNHGSPGHHPPPPSHRVPVKHR